MRGLLVVTLVAGTLSAHADPAKPVCQRTALAVTKLIGGSDQVQTLLGRRCDQDHWSRDAQACFASAPSDGVARTCLDKLSKDQRTQLEADADRLGDAKLTRWLTRRVLVARTQPPLRQ